MTIALEGITKRFGTEVALDDVSLEIGRGDFFVVLGPSGCGKSTLLRLIAGLERPDAGRIALDGRTVDDAAASRHEPPETRGVGVVFQSYALWPHMTVAEQVAFPLRVAGVRGEALAARGAECLATVDLERFAGRRPDALSGGQRQRVALARCLAQEASVILMDEPLANLDPHLRASMEEELAAFHARTGATTLYITHDQREAMALADRIAVLGEGRVLQVAAPDELYRRPRDARVAAFVGQGTIVGVRIEATRGSDGGGSGAADGERLASCWLCGHRLEACCRDGQPLGPGRLFVRPENVTVLGEAASRATTGAAAGTLRGRVAHVAYRGGIWEARLDVGGVEESASLVTRFARRPHVGEELALRVEGAWLLPGESLGESIEAAANAGRARPS